METKNFTLKTRMVRFFSLITKEFFSVWRDPKTRSLLFLPPIIQLFLFSHAATLDIENISIAVLNEDNTPVSREFLSRVSSSKYFKKIIYTKNLKEFASLIDREIVRGGVYIKNDFSKNFYKGQNPSVEVILDGRHTNGSQIIGNYLTEIAGSFALIGGTAGLNTQKAGMAYGATGLDTGRRGTASPIAPGGAGSAGAVGNSGTPAPLSNKNTAEAGLKSAPAAQSATTAESAANSGGKSRVKAKVRNWYNPNLYYHWFIISSLVGILPMSMVMLLSALSLAKEKETGTFDELLVSPLKPYEILAGKLVVPLFFGIIDGILILAAAKFVFKMPFEGNYLLYLFSLFVFLLSITGVGLFISSFAKTQQQAMLGVFVFMFPCLILSGYSAPVENITPKILQNLTVINPLRFFLVISKGIILKNINFYVVMLNLIPIIIITFFTLSIANFSFRNKLE